ncbi:MULTISPECIES: RsmB/NOP family class I SAM-dependent RNA methyltransferase [unclassified Pseudoclavibacter]|uniref:RsmB/NOP family class I SAM-dependent RNA methyltransferase n=1 Tax=unclassified Pseudoclavibacter TaxID=2615177 RepID=UPI001BA7622E|nr:transcription antitermination factor NusB [Pseudoclavibacter sp. Marseille-Q4354]MBS3177968.1 rRNA small subunit methyltransferase B [Pseudoclavibacter sp. Marseille-Q4354]
MSPAGAGGRGGSPYQGRRRPDQPPAGRGVTRSRQVAFEVLRAVDEDDAYANLLLPHRISAARLSPSDAGLATELTYGTLRRRGTYDAIIAEASGRDIRDIDPPLLDVLRLGAHQLLSMRTPSHAAVNESVEQAARIASRGASGFVNAILRKISRTDLDDWLDQVSEGLTEERALAVRNSHPDWIVRALRDALTAEHRGDELAASLAANNESPAVSVVALPGFDTPDELVASNPDLLVPGRVSPRGLTLASGDPSWVPQVKAGRARVQDEGSQLVTLALLEAEPVRPGERWLDMCAGPGGKAALLAASATELQAKLTANELVPARAGLVRAALAPLAAPVTVTNEDGRAFADTHPGTFDRVLLDAPCTGLGALRRRPEARWRKQSSDVAELVQLQEELLQAALVAVRPGGIVAYVTCSPHQAETTAVVRRAVRLSGAEVLDAAAIVTRASHAPDLDLGARPLGDGTLVQLWPHRHGTDAMFLALLRRAPAANPDEQTTRTP